MLSYKGHFSLQYVHFHFLKCNRFAGGLKFTDRRFQIFLRNLSNAFLRLLYRLGEDDEWRIWIKILFLMNNEFLSSININYDDIMKSFLGFNFTF